MSEPFDDYRGIESATWSQLADAAQQVRRRAYVPYSEFPVGAALWTATGDVVTGCNVEIASIGATVCAERTAIGCAIASGHSEFRALCVVTGVKPPSAPCGICRQVLVEFCDDLPILMVHPSGSHRFTTLHQLLPLRFSGLDFVDREPDA